MGKKKLRVDESAFSKTGLFLENIFTFMDGRLYCTLYLHFVFFWRVEDGPCNNTR